MHRLPEDDSTVYRIIQKEETRLKSTLDLIAAENQPSPAVMEAQGSVFSIKAAEGYPGARYHAGCGPADELEQLAVNRAKTLFQAEHANVQPHSGVTANLAVYFSVLEMGDRVLSMKLAHGGHLSHGDPASITSRCFQFKHYSVNRHTECIDYDEVNALAHQYRPRMLVVGASSYSRLIDYARMAAIAHKVSAYLMVDMAHIAGLVAAKVIPSPVSHSDFITFTTYKTLMGGRGGVILCRDKFSANLDKTVFPGSQGTPSLNMVAAKAVCFKKALEDEFIQIQRNVIENAKTMAAELQQRGYRIVSGGTDNHLVLVDLRSKGIKGHIAEAALESAGIIVNRNPIPYDPEKPGIASGIRLGSPAVTARGMGPVEMREIIALVDTILSDPDSRQAFNTVAGEVARLCRRFPIK
ncbi:MAG: serine hydroxymethyltransferase [Desulfobacterales bacterium]|nr:serine hydroxymethyltransferase [Desulfobacterales bacterium]